MSRETKQDRTARNIHDQVMEHLHELKGYESNPNIKEMDVERWSQSFLRSCLGYTASAGYSIRAQEAKGKMRPDLIVHKDDKPIFVVEVKKLGFDLRKSDFRSGKIQLSEYLKLVGDVRWGVLTNGHEWKLYDFSQREYGGVEISSFDLRSEEETVELNKKMVEEQCYEILDFHEIHYASETWEELLKEAMAFSPESLAKTILSHDIIRHVARSIRGEHEYRANMEVLTDKVYWLLEEGLNDAIGGWNENKRAELQKYIKSQKRASRRTKRTRKEAPPAPKAEDSVAPDTAAMPLDGDPSQARNGGEAA